MSFGTRNISCDLNAVGVRNGPAFLRPIFWRNADTNHKLEFVKQMTFQWDMGYSQRSSCPHTESGVIVKNTGSGHYASEESLRNGYEEDFVKRNASWHDISQYIYYFMRLFRSSNLRGGPEQCIPRPRPRRTYG